jgi:hypothetical protein
MDGRTRPPGGSMANENSTLLTAGAIAKQLGVTDAKVKKVITEIGLVPTAKKGCCNYFDAEAVQKLQAVLK